MATTLEPLRQPVFRRIWIASLFSNFGLLVQGVGAAWAMTRLSDSNQFVALVQSALMLPTMLFSLGAGALADMYDRRKVALGAILLSFVSAALLAAASRVNILTSVSLLLFCFVIGSGQALFGPSWQASVSEQVPPSALSRAVGLNSVSYNLARSFGPAIGGVVVAIGGAFAAFATNALFYLPLILVLASWRRVREIPRLPPERLAEAVAAGVRYVTHSPPIRAILTRTFTIGIGGGVIQALLPLIVYRKLGGDARTYGLLLGMFGLGAVIGALGLSPGRRIGGDQERVVRAETLILAGSVLIIAASPWVVLSAASLVLAGTAWLSLANIFNISVQMVAPRWVAGRALAAYQAAISGGVAIGAWFWGLVADIGDVSLAFYCAALLIAALPLLAVRFRMPVLDPEGREMVTALSETTPALAITPRSGPIILIIEYRIDPVEARAFYTAIQDLQLVRRRNGARDWSVSRDVDDPWMWLERFQFSTWLEYLRHRDRPTLAEEQLQRSVSGFHRDGAPISVHRLLGRPLGSVRWKEDAPDAQAPIVAPPPGAT